MVCVRVGVCWRRRARHTRRQMDGWYRSRAGWIDRWIDGWMDGWIASVPSENRTTTVYVYNESDSDGGDDDNDNDSGNDYNYNGCMHESTW